MKTHKEEELRTACSGLYTESVGKAGRIEMKTYTEEEFKAAYLGLSIGQSLPHSMLLQDPGLGGGLTTKQVLVAQPYRDKNGKEYVRVLCLARRGVNWTLVHKVTTPINPR